MSVPSSSSSSSSVFFIVRGPLKWALLAGTALSIALAWGHNMMWLTDLFIDYMPLYNKFRTVSSILVIAEFTIPALAVLALVEFARHPRSPPRQDRRICEPCPDTAALPRAVARTSDLPRADE